MSALAHPAWAPPLALAWLALTLLLTAAAFRARRRRARLGLHAGADGARDSALALAALALVLALLGPQLGTRRVSVPAEGLDLVVLLDVSRSMDATDVAPSRLTRAREAARAALLGLAPGDRAALAVFAGRGALLTPLTHDIAALLELLPVLDSEWMSDRGSRLGAGLEAAFGAFEAASPRPRVVLALGDGEHVAAPPPALLERLAHEQVRVVAAAFGSADGIVLAGPAGPVRDPSGESVVTKRVLRDFERVTAASGGSVLAADAWGALDAGALLAAARRGLHFGAGGRLERELPARYDRAAAALAFILLLAELLAGTGMRLRGWRALAGRGAQRAALAALALGALGAGDDDIETLEARVRAAPDDARALVALGVARAEGGEPAEAVHALTAAALRARTPEDVALASYDLGVALLAVGDAAGARDAFLDALAFDPSDRQAKFNLEWALRASAQEDANEPPPAAAPANESAEAEHETSEEREPEPRPTPEPAEDAPRDPAAPPDAAAADPAPRPLTPEEIARWLDTLRDAPPPALRHADESGGGPRSGPQW